MHFVEITFTSKQKLLVKLEHKVLLTIPPIRKCSYICYNNNITGSFQIVHKISVVLNLKVPDLINVILKLNSSYLLFKLI